MKLLTVKCPKCGGPPTLIVESVLRHIGIVVETDGGFDFDAEETDEAFWETSEPLEANGNGLARDGEPVLVQCAERHEWKCETEPDPAAKDWTCRVCEGDIPGSIVPQDIRGCCPTCMQRAAADCAALDLIALAMDGKMWGPDALQEIADRVRTTGRTIGGVDRGDDE